jgi:adenylate kinase
MKHNRQTKFKIAIMGVQAAGKGTQAHILSVTQNLPLISTGDLLREIAREDSDRGRMVKTFIDKGEFPPDEIVIETLKGWIAAHPGGWIIEGFPRTVEQAEAAIFFQPDLVLSLEMSDEDAKRRISYRRICVKCQTHYNIITQPPRNSKGVCDVCGGEIIRRPDDVPELVGTRLAQYRLMTEPLKEWYRKRGKLVEIDARPGMKEVAHEIDLRLREVRKRGRRFSRLLTWVGVALLSLALIVTLLIYIGSNV